MRVGCAIIPWASAGADRHARFSVWSLGSRQGRSDPGPCVEFILEDDRRRLAIDARPVGVALGSRRGSARPAPLHRTEPVLGEVTGQALVAKG